MKLKRFLTGVLSAVMALSVCALPAAAAEEGNTTGATPPKTSTSTIDTTQKGSITIHKYVMVDTTKATIPNNGEAVSTDKIPAGATATPGAVFTLYKVMTKDELIAYYNNGAETTPKAENYLGSDGKADIEKVRNFDDADRNGEKCVVEMPATDTDGVSTISGLELGLYLAVETTTPAAVTSAIQPFLISVPMTKVDTAEDDSKSADSWLYDIHVYPKNSTAVGEITLKKLGVIGNDTAKGSALKGVKFKLEHLIDGKQDAMQDAASWEQIDSTETDKMFTTNDSGIVTVSNLRPGTYRFTEIGYADKSENKFIINKDAQYVFVVTTNTDGKTVTVSQPKTPPENKDDYKAESSQVTVYNYAPDVDKQVKNRTDGKYQEASDYAVGDTISYKVAVTVPKNITKLRTFFLTDKPENMEDDSNSVKVFSDENCTTDITSAVTASTDGITVTSDKGFKVTFVPQNLVNYAGKTIYITYNAKLTKSADTTTTGNLNTIDLTYSNKIKSDTEPEDETNDCNHIEDTAVVYTFQIDITKVGKNGNTETPLNGVTFKLYEQIVHQTENVEKVLSDDEAKALGFADTTNFSYKEVATDTTKEGGKLTFTGLSNSKAVKAGASRYWLVETQTKEGYNLLGAPVEAKLDIVYKTTWKEENEFKDGVLVKHKHTSSTEDFKKATDGAQTNGGTQEGTEVTEGRDQGVYGSLSTKIINKKGFQLPVTGGFGTLLFSGIGVLLVLAGVAVLFSMKKKNDRT